MLHGSMRNWILRVAEDQLRNTALELFQEAFRFARDPNSPAPRHLSTLDAVPFLWDEKLEKWRADPIALKAANHTLAGASWAMGPSTSRASIGAAVPETTTTTIAPVEPALSSTSTAAEVLPATMEQASDTEMSGIAEPGQL